MNECTQLNPSQQERRGGTSATNAYYDQLCPGRHLAQKGLPEPEDSNDAAFGRAIHDALSGQTVVLDASQLSIVESCEEITKKLMGDVFGFNANKAVVRREQRYWVMVAKQFLHSGKLDLIAIHDRTALIIEYKSLPGKIQDADENMQLRDQTSLAGGMMQNLDEIFVAAVQPLVTHNPSMCRYDRQAINTAISDMFRRVTASNNPNAPRIAGEVQCKFCLARHNCPQYLKMVENSLPNIALIEIASTDVRAWTPEQRAIFCQRYPVAEKWIDECKRQIKIAMENDPNAVPGFYLEKGSVRRPVKDVAELHERFLARGGKTEDLLKCLKVGKGDLEVALRSISPLKGKAFKAFVDEMLNGIVEEKPDAPSISKI
jgi:hypothetical protein